MYRESLLGVALGATLQELESSCNLSEGQKEHLWEIFDAAMERTLAESPVTSQVIVSLPHPSLLGKESGSGGAPVPSKTTPQPMSFSGPTKERSSSTTVVSRCDVLDDGTTYPVYRVSDGIWTILLKNPTLKVKDAVGRTETIQLDYLKVNLKDVTLTDSTKMKIAGKKRKR